MFTHRVNKGNLRDLHTQWKSMWLKLKLQKAEQKHEWQLSTVHEVIRCWHDIWWCDFKCLLCAECKIWNNKAKDEVSNSSIIEGKTFIDLTWASKYFCKYSTKHRNYIFWDLSQYIWTSWFSFLMTMSQNSCSSSIMLAILS